MAIITSRARTRGGNVVCYDSDSERIKIWSSEEKFGTILYENAGKNASPNEIAEACHGITKGLEI